MFVTTLSFRLSSYFWCLVFIFLMFLQEIIVFPVSLYFTGLHRWHFCMAHSLDGLSFTFCPKAFPCPSHRLRCPSWNQSPRAAHRGWRRPIIGLLALLCLHEIYYQWGSCLPFSLVCQFKSCAWLTGTSVFPLSPSSWRAKVCVKMTSQYNLHSVWFSSSGSFCSFYVSRSFVTSNFF